jgi:bacterioferritin-associated ferredoxin
VKVNFILNDGQSDRIPKPHAMLVCHCHAICDKVIRATVRGGATTLDSVGELCGAGTGCGGCAEHIEALVEQELTVAGAERGMSLPVVSGARVGAR